MSDLLGVKRLKRWADGSAVKPVLDTTPTDAREARKAQKEFDEEGRGVPR